MGEQHRNIVIVEDDPSMDVAIVRLLRAVGLQPQSFPSAEALLASNAAADADCFVFDVQLPGISGFELRARLAKEGNMRPVIFITAYDHATVREQVREAGAAGFFPKPFPGREFVQAVLTAAGAE